MTQLVAKVTLLLAAAFAAVAATEAPEWRIRSFLDDPKRTCGKSRVELVLRSESGSVLATHAVSFENGLHDTVWPVANVTGEVALEVHRIDCAGVRARVAQIATAVKESTMAKQVYIAAVVQDEALDPHFVEVDTYRAGDGHLSVRRAGSRLVLTNRGEHTLELCRQPGVQAIRDEYLVDGEWRTSSANHWDLPRDASVVEPGVALTARPTILKYLPPRDDQPREPDAARVLIAIKPAGPTHVALGKVPTSFLGFPGCDFVFVSRAVTEDDKIWLRDAAP